MTGFPAGPGTDSAPRRITAGPDGNLWFTTGSEDAGRRIGRMTPTGVVTWLPLPSGLRPVEIGAGPDGNLWFTKVSSRGIAGVWGIGRITPDGVVTGFPVGRGRPALFGITPGPDGAVWFIAGRPDYGRLNRIGRIAPSGRVTMFSPGAGAAGGVAAITAGPDGNVWFTVPWGDRVGRITPAGAVRLFRAGITRESMPTGIAAALDGNLWFSEPNGHHIGRITPDGTVSEFPPAPVVAGARLRGSGTVLVGLRCPHGAPSACRGTLTLRYESPSGSRTRVGARRFTVSARHRAELAVPLWAAGRRALRDPGRLPLRIETAWRPHSGFGTAGRRVVLSLRAPATPNHTAAQARSFVTRIYAPYARADTRTPLLGNCFFDPPTGRPCAGPISDYVTPELAGELRRRANLGTGSDPMDCAQNTPGAVIVGTPRVRGSQATIVVQEVYSVSGHHPIIVTLDLGSLKLTDVRCDRRLEPL